MTEQALYALIGGPYSRIAHMPRRTLAGDHRDDRAHKAERRRT